MTPITTATFVRLLPNWRGDARLYRLSRPVTFAGSASRGETNYVAVSAVDLPSIIHLDAECETYIFPADADGEVLSWSELPGSTKGTIFHEVAIEEAGWVLR